MDKGLLIDARTFIPGIERALAKGGATHSVQDVLNEIEAGRAQLWIKGDALIVTQIINDPTARTLHFWLTTGSLDPVLKLHEEVKEWGRTMSCTRATLTGRRGWLRTLAGKGWHETLVLMEAKL